MYHAFLLDALYARLATPSMINLLVSKFALIHAKPASLEVDVLPASMDGNLTVINVFLMLPHAMQD